MRIVALVLFLVGAAGNVWAGIPGSVVDVEIRSESGRLLPMYPVAVQSESRKVYVEAVKGD